MPKAQQTYSAQTLRKQATKSEQMLWQRLRNRQILDYKFRRQHVIKGYILDFYCHQLKLAIEIDGLIHEIKDQKEYDMERQSNLEDLGISFLRISSNEVEKNINNVIENIKQKILSLSRKQSEVGEGARRAGEGL